MAKNLAADTIMAPDKMKPLLALSKREPVQAAIGLTADGEGVILLHKTAKPKKVFAMLKAAAAKSKLPLNPASLRFGRAEVDTDYDAAMVRFFINKEAPGNLRLKLVEVVKRIPYQKVEINVDAALEDEPEEEAEGQEASAPAAPPPPPPPAPGAAAAPDPELLKQELALLIGQIPGACGSDPAVKAALAKLAADATLNLRTNNLAAAEGLIGRLRDAVAHPEAVTTTPAAATQPARPPREPPAGMAGAVNYAKCRLIWLGTRKKIEADIDRLADAVREAYADEGTGDTLGEMFRQRVAPIMAGFDESLADKLDEAVNQTDPEKHQALVAEARQIIGRYGDFLATEPLIAKLDANTLLPVAIAQTMNTALQALSAAIR